ncbi:MAG TPA: 2OG-Fe(II) oxygenase [Streptosporangiaceae bacterium]|nr:2OG-Fe(II) oxygenase [Streptosporangiaceae bacterium]
MAQAPRERLAKLLDDAESPGAFSAQLLVPADSLHLEVKGAGQIRLPVRAPQARKLCDIARPARFGVGEQTLTDPSVRDTWEIPPDLVTITGPKWAAALEGVLDEVRDQLGLPLSSRLEAGLHAMLVYGPGQFFLPHQDSEKDDAMIGTLVGTLVVTLPSSHTGGELIVEHGGESVAYRSSKDSLSFVAFYADCRHQVKPVKSGYRVTLTFNLLAHTDRTGQAADQPVAELARCLTGHFTTRASKRYGTGDLDPPHRLVYLLDHEYTERGLSWNRLKGTDTERAALLRAAADQADCEAVLALAEVKETWDCYPSEDQWDDYGDEDEDEDDCGDDPDPDGYEFTDLIDSDISLGWWTSPSGKGGESISLHVPDSEVCATTPSVELKPYQSEYEGYMGNYGNTMDRWYRRAAVVVWPRERAFVARAEASASWALHELRSRIHVGDLTGARAAAQSLAPFWDSTAKAKPPLLESALDVATGLDEPSAAAVLLHPFWIESLAPENATAVAALVARYGEPWTNTVLDGWLGSRQSWAYQGDADRLGWIQSLPLLCDALIDTGEPGAAAARRLLAASWRWLSDEIRLWVSYSPARHREERLDLLSRPLARLLEAAAVIGETALRDAILTALREHSDNVLACLIPALRASTALSQDRQRASGLDILARDCAERLGEIIGRPPRAEDDWSIPWPPGCDCDLCGTLREFLTSRSRRSFEWPLAKEKRRHVHTRIDTAELPVRHETRRRGSPYTLVLTKTQELFERERGARHRAVTDLTWLTENSGFA